MSMTIIDASDHVVGRLASVVAKRLLDGEEIIVVNAEKALITGDKAEILKEFRWRMDVGSTRKGPYYPKRPDRILERAINGMVPHKRPRGKTAMKKLKVYVAVPEEFKDKKLERIPEASRVTAESFLSLGDISKHLGAEF
jgi:large subunit ribosomal protein L13